MCPHQKPVDVHEQQHEEKSIKEEVEGDVGHRLETGHTGGIEHFEREPVQAKPEPDRNTAKTRNRNIMLSFNLHHLFERI